MRQRHADLVSTPATHCPSGHVEVLRCYPLRGESATLSPFPTLYWLACPHLVYELSRLEHEGWIARLQERVAADPDLRRDVHDDHRRYIEERLATLRDDDRDRAIAAGFESALSGPGIGGIRNFDSVKCLHLHYAYHLVRGSAIGRILDAEAPIPPCPPATDP